jgi:DmsE family decaheme c-type cytochrome
MRKFGIFILVLALLVLFGLTYRGFTEVKGGKPKSGGKTYAGQEACTGCHADKAESLQKSIHGKTNVPGSPATMQGCESCHGPGSEHVAQGGGKGVGGVVAFTDKKVSAGQKSKMCLACHGDIKELAFWKNSEHLRNGVDCSSCHSVHGEKKMALKPKEPEACLSCHKDIRRDMFKYSRHPILEGKVKCSDCHNPHGTLSHHMVRAENNNQLCYKCHAEKRGPYLWEHPPVEENCVICHNPHGSKTAKLLQEKVPYLCQDCHDWQRHPGTIYDAKTGFTGSGAANRFFARSCLNCHSQIHGSNAPVDPTWGYHSGKAFVR